MNAGLKSKMNRDALHKIGRENKEKEKEKKNTPVGSYLETSLARYVSLNKSY